MAVELVRRFIMKALDGRLFDCAVHPFDLAIGPGVGRLGEALLDTPLVAELPDGMAPHVDMMRQVTELNAVVGQQFMHLIRNLGQDPTQESHGNRLGGLGM